LKDLADAGKTVDELLTLETDFRCRGMEFDPAVRLSE
jgi:hypothetical protein